MELERDTVLIQLSDVKHEKQELKQQLEQLKEQREQETHASQEGKRHSPSLCSQLYLHYSSNAVDVHLSVKLKLTDWLCWQLVLLYHSF